MQDLNSQALVRLLASDERRRVFAALVLGANTLGEVVDSSGLTVRDASAALDRLAGSGLVERTADGSLFVLEAAFSVAARSEAPAPAPSQHGDQPDDVARVLDKAIVDGRLVAWPAKRGRRRVILEWVAQNFEPGKRFTEKQINATLAGITDDPAMMRRYLVDEDFMDREHGEYWRCGGLVKD